MTTFTTEDRKNASSPPHIVDSGASVNKENFEKSVKEIFGNNKKIKIEEVDAGVYVVEISKKDDDFDMDGRC
jgi:hypothetical protein